MKIALCSNYLNHHQLTLCRSLFSLTGGEFRFLACSSVPSERKKVGYEDWHQEEYVLRAYEKGEQLAEALRWCLEADVFLFGNGYESFSDLRRKSGKPIVFYSERIFRQRRFFQVTPKAKTKLYQKYSLPNKNPTALLCTGAYVAADFNKVGLFRSQTYRWGYFPNTVPCECVEKLVSEKEKNSLLWVGRLIPLKHPEYLIRLAEVLKKQKIDFVLRIIGSGSEEASLKRKILKKGLKEHVIMMGSLPNDEVIRWMKKSEIFLFPSDRREGWGAVLNEAMGCACAVVSSAAVGATRFLITHRENGMIFQSGSQKDFIRCVRELMEAPEKRCNMAQKARQTITEQWNGEIAAQRLLQLCESLSCGEKEFNAFSDGVLSRAPIVRESF